MESKFRLAFVGVDHPHGWLYRESLKRMPEVEVVAFYARSEDETKTLQEPFTSRPVYTSISRLLAEEDFEGVMVMLPNNEEPKACLEFAVTRSPRLAWSLLMRVTHHGREACRP